METKTKTKQRALNNALPLLIVKDELPVVTTTDLNRDSQNAVLFKKTIPVPVIKTIPSTQNPSSLLSGFTLPDHYIKFQLHGGAEAGRSSDSYDLTDEDMDWLYSNYLSSKNNPRDLSREQIRDSDIIRSRSNFFGPASGTSCVNLMDLFEKYAASSSKSASVLEKERLEIFAEHRLEELILFYEVEAYVQAPLKVCNFTEYPEAVAVANAIERFKVIPVGVSKSKVLLPSFFNEVYQYWNKRRQVLGKALIRRLQTPPDINEPSPLIAFRPREVRRHASSRIADQKKVSLQLSTIHTQQYQKLRQLKQDGEKLKLLLDSMVLREEIKREKASLISHAFDLRLGETEFGKLAGLGRVSIDDAVRPLVLPDKHIAYKPLLFTSVVKPNMNLLNSLTENLLKIEAESKRLKMVTAKWTVDKPRDDSSGDDEPRDRPKPRPQLTLQQLQDDAVIDALINPLETFFSNSAQLPQSLRSLATVTDDSTLALFSHLEVRRKMLSEKERSRELEEISVIEEYQFEDITQEEKDPMMEDLVNRKIEIASKFPSVDKNGVYRVDDHHGGLKKYSILNVKLEKSPTFLKQKWESDTYNFNSINSNVVVAEESNKELTGLNCVSSLIFPVAASSKKRVKPFLSLNKSLCDGITRGRPRVSQCGLTRVDIFNSNNTLREIEPVSDEIISCDLKEHVLYHTNEIEELYSSVVDENVENVSELKDLKRVSDQTKNTSKRQKYVKTLANISAPLPIYNVNPDDSLKLLNDKRIWNRATHSVYLAPLISQTHICANMFLVSRTANGLQNVNRLQALVSPRTNSVNIENTPKVLPKVDILQPKPMNLHRNSISNILVPPGSVLINPSSPALAASSTIASQNLTAHIAAAGSPNFNRNPAYFMNTYPPNSYNPQYLANMASNAVSNQNANSQTSSSTASLQQMFMQQQHQRAIFYQQMQLINQQNQLAGQMPGSQPQIAPNAPVGQSPVVQTANQAAPVLSTATSGQPVQFPVPPGNSVPHYQNLNISSQSTTVTQLFPQQIPAPPNIPR